MKICCGFSSVRGCVAGGLALLLIVGAVIQPALTSASDRKHFARIGKTQPQSQSGKAKKVPPLPPERGTPVPNLPNLDGIRQRQRSEAQAPAPIESTKRSRRKSGKSPPDKKSHHVRSRTALTRNLRYKIATEPMPPQSGQPLFTDDPLKNPNNPDSFKIKAIHITELRAAINTVRNRRHLPDYSWVKPTASGGAINSNIPISWEPIDEMRTALNQAIGAPPNGYAAGLGINLPILGSHVQELRERVKDILGITSIADQFVPSRIDPLNESGNQIEARDCEWGLPLVSLPGRAGLDLGIGLSYSSMVWTQAGSSISFDDDWGDPSPGFKIGFPTVQGRYTDNQVGANVYLLITSAGRRVELRRVGTSNIYEAGDSSYLQLIDNGSSLLVRTTDGTQMSYGKFGSDWHCTAIEDRNGNLILANYNSFGDIVDITDTLGRTFTFHYDGNYNLQSITQTWTVNGVATTHTWATFGWGAVTMHPAFSNVTVVGTFDGEVIPVLTQVGLADGSHYNFEYTDRGQVNVIRHYAADGGPGTADDFQLSYLAYNYESPAADCPRISAARVWASNWSDVAGVPHEVTSYFADNHDGSHQVTAPDGTVYKELYGGSGDLPAWQHGLVTSTQVISGSVQKTTTTGYRQDNENVNYQTNPRVSQTVVSDGTNNRKTTIDYQTFALPVTGSNCSLPNDVYEYDADQSTVLRHTHSHYLPDVGYLDNNARGNRLIGLQDETDVYQGAGTTTLVAKITYAYDQTVVSSQAINAPGHDHSYDNSSAAAVRGNLTGVSRFDVNTNSGATTTSMTYDAAGNLLTTTDPAGHTTSIAYADSFSDNLDHNTFAYPTVIKDPDWIAVTAPNNYSKVEYSFDFSAQTRTQGPPPGNPGQYANGIIQTFSYDEATRLKQVTTTNSESGAYVHYEYGPDYTSSFASVNSVAANYWESDSYTNKFFDGLGRVFAVASNHPGSTGGNKGQYTRYDQMGRVSQQTNPTEMTGGWVATGDDAYNAQTDTGDWRFNHPTEYDWKGRPLKTYNMDGTYKEASYAGCGCAGGEVVTIEDEVGRQQKVYSDVLARQWKTEVLTYPDSNNNNTRSVYSTTVNVFNTRDQVTLMRQYAGTDQSSTHQDTTMSYDGYGRLQRKHVPEQQDSNGNPTYTTYAYNNDDTAYSITDARGAGCTYGYNGRHQVTSAMHVLSGQTTISIGYGYDAAGNRTSMGDAQGSTSYVYDSLSRMTSETRTINGLGNYSINYGYNLAHELTTITDPFGAQIGYTRDTVGRTTAVTGSGFANISIYASNIKYRAWGGQKSVTYDGDGTSATTSYNSRMQPSSYLLPGLREQFQYYDDGRLQQMTDLDDRGQDIGYPDTARHFSRAQSYDHVGRLVSATGSPSTSSSLPYNQSYGYNEFGNAASRSGSYYYQGWTSDGGTFQNNRRQDMSYDLDGNVTHTPTYAYAGGPVVSYRDWTYDAAGEMTQVKETLTSNNSVSTYITNNDGDGQPAIEYYQENLASKSFMVRSSVLGGKVVTRLDNAGNKSSTVFDVDGLLTVVQNVNSFGSSVRWTHVDPVGLSEAGDTKSVFDPMGNHVVWQHAPVGPPPNAYPPSAASFGGLAPSFGYAINSSCILDGIPTDCSLALNMLERGSAEQCPNNYCGPSRARNGDLVPLTRDPDTGALGYYSPPQNPPQVAIIRDAEKHIEDNYDTCQKKYPSDIPKDAAKKIVGASILDGVPVTLMSVTWRYESGFKMDPDGNARYAGDGVSVNGYDVGPLQTSTNYYNKEKFTRGFDNPFGMAPTMVAVMTGLGRAKELPQHLPYTGDANQMIHVSARAFTLDILPRSHGKDELHRLADAAGTYRGPGDYQGRHDKYLADAPADQNFFDCLLK